MHTLFFICGWATRSLPAFTESRKHLMLLLSAEPHDPVDNPDQGQNHAEASADSRSQSCEGENGEHEMYIR